MKATINGKRYDTDTAEIIGEDSARCGRSDFRYWEETLYRTNKGAFFIHGDGGPMTRYSVQVGNGYGSGSEIRPLSREEAFGWCQEHCLNDAIDAHFSDMVEEA